MIPLIWMSISSFPRRWANFFISEGLMSSLSTTTMAFSNSPPLMRLAFDNFSNSVRKTNVLQGAISVG